MNAEIDIRDLLATISVPTLVLHRAHESWRDGSRYMGEHIPGARMVELPGNDHLPWEGDAESLLDEIERFLSGVREEVEPDRVLATLLSTDIVGSDREGSRSSATATGRTCSPSTTASCAHSSRAFAAARSTSARRRRLRDIRRPGARGPMRLGDRSTAQGAGPRRAGRRAHGRGRAGGAPRRAASPSTLPRRIAAAARPGEVLVSSTVKDIVAGSGIAFEERGEHELTARRAPGVSSPPGSDRGSEHRGEGSLPVVYRGR